MKDRRIVRVLDTTLRDGEQTPGVSLTPQEKLEIAKALDALGVDVIEAGFPITSKGEQEGIKLIAKAALSAEVSGLARADKADIDTAIGCGVKGVHVFLASSNIHLEHKLHIGREEMLKRSAEAVRYAKGFGVTVEFSAEDATRTDLDFFKRVVKAVSDAGIDRFDIPDTVGTATPEKMAAYVRAARSVTDRTISVHCHDDYGLAVANSLTGIVAGADQAHVTINGLGERAGNTSLEEFVMSCHNLYSIDTRINTELLYETSRLVSRLTGVMVQPNKAIVGENAFGHESGIHTHGVLSNPLTYEPFRALEGWPGSVVSGREARGKARHLCAAERSWSKTQGGAPKAHSRQGQGDGRSGNQHNRRRPVPDCHVDHGRGDRGEEPSCGARGTGGRNRHQRGCPRRRSSSWSGVTSTRKPTLVRVPLTLRLTPFRRYSATSRLSVLRSTGWKP